MNISLNWLSAMLGRPLEAADTARRIWAHCVPVDAVEPLHQDLGDVVIGLVEKVEKHPNADRLSLCVVNNGAEQLQVVCGAPNVAAGKKYPFAPVGATLPGGLTLTARKIRGVASQGMLCSAKELGLGTDHDGILELNTDAAPGTRFLEAMPIADYRLVLDVTPNRPDLLGHRGVARELAASLGATVKLPIFPGAPADTAAPRRSATSGTVDGVAVAIEDTAGCPRLMAAVIRGVKIGPSPAWLEARLRSVGARPINNLVDATNYILFELNQPMHAYDKAKLKGPKLVARKARAGERLTTLDGVNRALTPSMTVIADGERPVGVAGVMGGVDSEVTAATTDIVLECASFTPKSVRATRVSLKLNTEASYRYERGIDTQNMAQALRRAVALIIGVAGGTADEAPVDLCPEAPTAPTVFLRPERVAHLLGVPVPRADIERVLGSVGFTVAPKDDRLAVQVPGWRPDVTAEVDLIEEIARLKGFDAFPSEIRPFRPSTVPDDPIESLKASVRRVLTGFGLNEARTLSLTAAEGDHAVPVVNPLASDQAHLRVDLMTGLTRGVERNWAARQRDVRLFEIGVVFRAEQGTPRPSERWRVGGVLSGLRHPAHWTERSEPEFDMWDARGMLEEVARVAGTGGAVRRDGAFWKLADDKGTVHGWAGPVNADAPPWAAPLVGFELDLVASHRAPKAFVLPATTPAAERDVALVLPAGVSAAQVEAVVRTQAGPLLESLTVFDEYRSPAMAGRSVAWRLVFRAADRTLKDDEVEAAVATALAALKEQLDVQLRQT